MQKPRSLQEYEGTRALFPSRRDESTNDTKPCRWDGGYVKLDDTKSLY